MVKLSHATKNQKIVFWSGVSLSIIMVSFGWFWTVGSVFADAIERSKETIENAQGLTTDFYQETANTHSELSKALEANQKNIEVQADMDGAEVSAADEEEAKALLAEIFKEELEKQQKEEGEGEEDNQEEIEIQE